MSRADNLNALHETLSTLCAKAERCFTEPVKVTLVVRNPGAPDGSRDVVISSDAHELAIAAIRTRHSDPRGHVTPAEVHARDNLEWLPEPTTVEASVSSGGEGE